MSDDKITQITQEGIDALAAAFDHLRDTLAATFAEIAEIITAAVEDFRAVFGALTLSDMLAATGVTEADVRRIDIATGELVLWNGRRVAFR